MAAQTDTDSSSLLAFLTHITHLWSFHVIIKCEIRKEPGRLATLSLQKKNVEGDTANELSNTTS